MAVLTLACLFALAEATLSGTRTALPAACWIILLGALLTCATRTRAIAQQLKAGP